MSARPRQEHQQPLLESEHLGLGWAVRRWTQKVSLQVTGDLGIAERKEEGQEEPARFEKRSMSGEGLYPLSLGHLFSAYPIPCWTNDQHPPPLLSHLSWDCTCFTLQPLHLLLCTVGWEDESNQSAREEHFCSFCLPHSGLRVLDSSWLNSKRKSKR